MDVLITSGSDSDDMQKYWVDWFLSLRGHEYFCEVDEDYLLDRFNLTGLVSDVAHYTLAFDLITDQLEEDLEDDVREAVEKSARHLYGLVHARFILSAKGLAKMCEKYKKAEFGRCPRVLCHNQPVLPVGLTDVPYSKSVKLYCPKCEDVYGPRSTRHAALDGSYWGTTFPHLFFQVYPSLLMASREAEVERYTPRIFGFKVHEWAVRHRLQAEARQLVSQRQKSSTHPSTPPAPGGPSGSSKRGRSGMDTSGNGDVQIGEGSNEVEESVTGV